MAGVSVHEAEIMARENLSEMRREYTRMRDIAQKRIQRLGESKFSDAKAYTSHTFKTETGEIVHGFQKLKNIDPSDFAKAYSELSKFTSAKASSVSGQKAIQSKTIQSWRSQGLGLNKDNYKTAIKILEEMRRQKITYGSDKVIELADSMLGLSAGQTNDWLDHLNTLLEHSEEIAEYVESGYTPVDIGDFIEEVGW